MKELSSKIMAIAESPSIKLARMVAELRSNGEKVIGLHVGEPDFDTPDEVTGATKEALDQKKTKYSLVAGTKELRSALQKKLRDFNHIDVELAGIMVGSGSKHILYSIFQVLLNPGDEVIVPAPYWVTIPESIKLAGGVPVFVDCKADHSLDMDAIKRSLTAKTKAIHINTPNNPSGAVYSEAALRELGNFCVENDLYIVSDEAYETLTYGDHKHVSIASLDPKFFERTLSAFTFSKSSCMTGYRLGYAAGPTSLTQHIEKLHSHLNGNIPEFIQEAGLRALTMDQTPFNEMSATMEKRAFYMKEVFADIFNFQDPQGALYHFIDVSNLLGGRFKTSIDLATHILSEAKVATLPGDYFGCPGYLRLCFATSMSDINEAAQRIRKVL